MRQSRVRANYYAVLSMKPHFWGRTIKPVSVCLYVCESVRTCTRQSICMQQQQQQQPGKHWHAILFAKTAVACWRRRHKFTWLIEFADPLAAKQKGKTTKPSQCVNDRFTDTLQTHMCCVYACKHSITSIYTLTYRSFYAKKKYLKCCNIDKSVTDNLLIIWLAIDIM